MTPPIPLLSQKALEFPLMKGHPNLCVQVRSGCQSAVLAVLGAGPPPLTLGRDHPRQGTVSWTHFILGSLEQNGHGLPL